eukprot:7655740-Lingulodinium_polyedra.AAC.1
MKRHRSRTTASSRASGSGACARCRAYPARWPPLASEQKTKGAVGARRSTTAWKIRPLKSRISRRAAAGSTPAPVGHSSMKR